MSKITWYDKPQRFTVTLVPRSTISYDEALSRIAELEAELEAAISQNGRERAKDILRSVHASVASVATAAPAPAKRRASRRQQAPLDDSVTAIVVREKPDGDGAMKRDYVRTARKTNETWYPVWTTSRKHAKIFDHSESLDLVSWLKKSRTVDRSYTYCLEKLDV